MTKSEGVSSRRRGRRRGRGNGLGGRHGRGRSEVSQKSTTSSAAAPTTAKKSTASTSGSTRSAQQRKKWIKSVAASSASSSTSSTVTDADGTPSKTRKSLGKREVVGFLDQMASTETTATGAGSVRSSFSLGVPYDKYAPGSRVPQMDQQPSKRTQQQRRRRDQDHEVEGDEDGEEDEQPHIMQHHPHKVTSEEIRQSLRPQPPDYRLQHRQHRHQHTNFSGPGSSGRGSQCCGYGGPLGSLSAWFGDHERNETVLVVLVAVVISLLYACMGVFGRGRCPVQPVLPLWAVITGCAAGAGIPAAVAYYSLRLGPYLKRSTNEDTHPSVWAGLIFEARKSNMGFCRVVTMVTALLCAATWWVFGAYLAYSVYWTVTFRETLDDPLPDTFCDAPAYYVTLQLQSLSWFSALLLLLWLVSSFLFDERFRRSLVDVLRYELVHADQLSYELHRHRERLTENNRREEEERSNRTLKDMIKKKKKRAKARM